VTHGCTRKLPTHHFVIPGLRSDGRGAANHEAILFSVFSQECLMRPSVITGNSPRVVHHNMTIRRTSSLLNGRASAQTFALMQRLGLGVLQCGWTGFASRIASQPADCLLSRVVESARSAVVAALRKDLIATPLPPIYHTHAVSEECGREFVHGLAHGVMPPLLELIC